jgi:GntR family histidine utilization transcriptional repressor
MTLPKFAQIKQHIIDKIATGEWQENDKVPSENTLAKDFSVSRMTARRALQELCDDGILNRTQGSGSYVASLKEQASTLEVTDIAIEIRQRNKSYSAIIHEFEEVEAIPPVAIALGVEIGSTVYHSIIAHCQDGVPLQVEDRFVNPLFATEYMQQDFSQITPHEYLTNTTPLSEAMVIIEAVMPSEQMKQWLELFNDEPCLQVQKRIFSKQGVVSFATLVHPGTKYRIGSQLTMKRR